MLNPNLCENTSPNVANLLDCFDNLSAFDQIDFIHQLFSQRNLQTGNIGNTASDDNAPQISIVIADLQDIPEVIDSIAVILTSTLRKRQGDRPSPHPASDDTVP